MKNNHSVLLSVILLFFLFLCSLKSSLFNFLVTDSISVYSSYTKLSVYFNVFFLTSLFYLLLLKFSNRWLFILFYIGQIVFLFVNLLYYFYFEGYLHFNQYFELLPETLQLMRHSAVPFEPRILIVFMDFPLFLFLVLSYKKLSFVTRKRWFRFGSYIPALFLIWDFKQWDWLKDGTPIQEMSDQYVSEISAVKKYGLLTVNLYHMFYIRAYSDLIKQFDYGQKIEKTNAQIDSCAQKNNVVIIQIESMDAFVINKVYHKNFVAPNLHALSRKYIYFPYMISYHKAGSTSDCEFSCVNSVEALDMFPSIKIRNYDFPNALPKRFTRASCDVAIYHGNKGEYFNRRIAFRKMGFPAFYDIDDMKIKEVAWGAPDGDVLNFVSNQVVRTTSPFYYHIITMSSHEPFTFVESYYSTKKFKTISDPIVKNYFTCISYVDSVVAKFVQDVQHARPNTIFLIYGDHTPAIKNNKTYTQAAYKDEGLYFEFVPLIIITPDRKNHFEKKNAASFLDIAPTALEGSGSPYEISSLGQNLLQPDSIEHKIPYRGITFSRKSLFKKINDLYQTSNNTLLH